MFIRASVLAAAGLLALHLNASGAGASKVSPLASEPDWSWLDAARTRSANEVLRALDEHYAVGGTAAGFVEVGPRSVRVRTDGETWKKSSLRRRERR